MKCIYCLEDKQSKDDFNKEHVLQESFGKFKGALTLTGEVCKVCNQYFGDGIDRILSRDSFEAFLRLRYGIKSSKEYSDILYNRLTITIPKGQDEWTGVKVVYQPPSVHLPPQVGFLRQNTRDHVYFTLPEIEKGLALDNLDVDKGSEV